MKKTAISFLLPGVLFVSGLKAQSIQEGMTHLYADRFKSAEAVFQKLLAANPNNIDAIYWLGQTYFDQDNNTAARQLYEKALQTNGNAPLILVGLGHADLLDKKTNEARAKFDQAITASRGRKGDDPIVLTAIGRANVDAKSGDLAYALDKLKTAAEKDPRNTETLLQLGNAHRKANPGEGGGPAYLNYTKALEVNPGFAVASIRLAKIFESQRNWDLVLKYLNEAVSRDPKFTLGYYELFWYYFSRKDFNEAENQLKKFMESKLPEKDAQDEYLYGQLCYVRKDFDCAIQKGEAVLRQLGESTKPRVYKLLAYAYMDKGSDYNTALKYANQYFTKEKPDEVISQDYKMKAQILAKTGGTPDEVFTTYIKGVDLDTTIQDKIDFLKEGVAFFKESKLRDKEALLLEKVLEIKPKPIINDYFDLAVAHYFSQNYAKAREHALKMRELFPDQPYGYEWAFNASNAVDTVKKDSIAAPDAMKLMEFAEKDTTKYKKQYISSVRFLAAYYVNVAKDTEKSLEYFKKWLAADSANATTIQGYIDQIEKATRQPARPNTSKGSNKTSSTKVTNKTKSTVTKPKAGSKSSP